MSLSKDMVLKLMAEHNIQPVLDLGRGRGRGLRWSEADVTELQARLRETAQLSGSSRKKVQMTRPSLLESSNDVIYQMLQKERCGREANT